MPHYKITGTIWYFDNNGNRQSADVNMEIESTSNTASMQELAMAQWAKDNNVALGSIDGWGNFKPRPLTDEEQAERFGAIQKGLGI